MSKSFGMKFLVLISLILNLIINSCSKKEGTGTEHIADDPILESFHFSSDSLKFGTEIGYLELKAKDPENSGEMKLVISIVKGNLTLRPISDVLMLDSAQSGGSKLVFKCLQDSFQTKLAFEPDTTGDYILSGYLVVESRKSETKNAQIYVFGNKPPVADFITSIEGEAYPKTVTFDASASYDPDGQIVKYTWYFQEDTISQENPVIKRQYPVAVNEQVELMVYDNEGASASIQKSIYLENKKPVASFTYEITSDVFPKTVHLDGSASHDDDGFVTKYIWIVENDTIYDAGATHNVSFDRSGNYNIQLIVADEQGLQSDPFSVGVMITNNSPTASLEFEEVYTASYPRLFYFDASNSTDDGTIQKYRWDFGDGNTLDTNVARVQHKYSSYGHYEVTLTVFDNEDVSDEKSVELTTTNTPPHVSIMNNQNDTLSHVGIPYSVTFSDSNIYDIDNNISTIRWYVDGNEIKTYRKTGDTKIDLTFDTYGKHFVIAEAEDEEGEKAADTVVVMISESNVIVAIQVQSGQADGDNPLTIDLIGKILSPENPEDIDSLRWDFGDGTGFEGLDPEPHTYDQPGEYLVLFTARSKYGKTGKDSLKIKVKNSAPVAKFSVSPDTVGTPPFEVTFDASESYDPNGDGLTYEWDFGDGTVITNGKVHETHVFDEPNGDGNAEFTVTLTVKDPYGKTLAEDSYQQTIRIHNTVPSGQIQITNNHGESSGPNPLKLNFRADVTDPDEGQTLSYHWKILDANRQEVEDLGNNQTVSYTFGLGTYYVVCEVSDGYATITLEKEVQSLNSAPVAKFTVSPGNEGTPPFEVTFDASESYDPNGDGLTYEWDFGDGTVITNGKVQETHVFDEPNGDGNAEFTVTLTVKDPYGKTLAEDSYQEIIRIHNTEPTGQIAVTNNNGQAEGAGPLSLQFRVNANDPDPGQTLSYSWQVLNADRSVRANLGTGTSASYTFPIGNYYIVCFVSDGYSNVRLEQTVRAVNVAPVAQIHPDWETLTFDGPSHTLEITDEYCSDANGNIAKFEWKLDGQLIATYGPGKRGAFDVEINGYGTHTIQLTVTDSAWATATDEVTVRIVNRPPTILLTASPGTSGQHPFRVTFTPTVNDPNGNDDLQGIVWDFGDGTQPVNSSVISPVTHTFNQPGQYTVTATVNDKGGNSSNAVLEVTVTNTAPNATFTVSPSDQGAPPFEVTFDATASSDPNGDRLVYSWDFGDGTIIPNGPPQISHTFDEKGGDGNAQFTVKLTVKDPYNKILAEDTYEKVITIRNTEPRPAIRATNNNGQFEGPYPLQLNLTVDPNDPDQNQNLNYRWEIRQNGIVLQTAETKDLTYTFPKGTFQVACTVSDGYSQITTYRIVNAISYAPTATLNASQTNGEYPLTVEFTQTVSDLNGLNDIDIMTLDFGDGSNPATLITPTQVNHRYGDPGNYKAVLTVRDKDNHVVTSEVNITVTNTPPVADLLLTNAEEIFNPMGLLAGSTFIFDASRSHDSRTPTSNLNFTYYWNHLSVSGEGGQGDTEMRYTPQMVGVFPVKVEVTDEKGAMSSKTIQVYSYNRAPVIQTFMLNPSGEIVYTPNSTVQLNISASDPDQNTPMHLRIEVTYQNELGEPVRVRLYDGDNISTFTYTLPNFTPKTGTVRKAFTFTVTAYDDVSGVPGAQNFEAKSVTESDVLEVTYIGISGGGGF